MLARNRGHQTRRPLRVILRGLFLDRAQHTAGRTLLESIGLGDLPGVGMVMIDGLVRCGRSRNTPPATEVPMVVGAH